METLVVMAMEEEEGGLLRKENVSVMFTGIGKINATYNLLKAISDHKPELVINFGTCGGALSAGQIVECVEFKQRDMPRIDGFYGPPILRVSGRTSYPKIKCSSGDSFVNNCSKNNVEDMEAYALAHVCAKEQVNFLCLKYISDAGDFKQWKECLPNASKAFLETYKELQRSLSL